MPQRRLYMVVLIAAAAVLLLMSVRFGFAEAWEAQYALPAAALDESVRAEQVASSDDVKPEPDADAPMRPKPAVLSQRVAEYHIGVALGEDGTLAGEQTITWKNPGRKPVSDMYFHLYPNAFAPGSTFLRESGGQLRGDRLPAGGRGAMEIVALTTENGETLLPRMHYIQPDDGNKADRTLATLRLPEAVKPGDTVTLRMKFKVTLPPIFARMGQTGDFVMAGQWFPKVAVYETAGTRGHSSEGWNLHQYHGNSEFYADFGIYSVRIQVPERYKVAATGFQTKTATVANGRKTYQFYADDVHDFAWAASPDFHYAESSFSSKGIPGVRIKLYLDPLHADLTDRYMHAAKSTLAKLGEWYGEYPYSTLSIVIPPKDASGAGGMEYPTLVTGAAAKSDNPGYELERTVLHEIAHQYWYGIIASNEFEEAWLDEGFTSYTEDKLMAAIYGVLPNTPIEASYLTTPEPLRQHSWRFGSSDLYAENVYMRGKLVLTAMERQLGEATMNRILRTYFSKFRFKHPSTADFQRVVESVTKSSWHDFFQAYVYHAEMADFAVEAIESAPSGDGYDNSVLLRRNGGRPEPVQVAIGFRDGETTHKVWDGSQPETRLQFRSASPVAYVAVDPHHAVVLDNYRFNNYLKAETDRSSGIRWNVGLSQLLDNVIAIFAW